jgi:hypothetical protein
MSEPGAGAPEIPRLNYVLLLYPLHPLPASRVDPGGHILPHWASSPIRVGGGVAKKFALTLPKLTLR